MQFLEILVSFILGGAGGASLFLVYMKFSSNKRNREIQREADLVLNRARSKAAQIERTTRREIKETEEKSRKTLEEEMRRERERLKQREYKLERQRDRMDMDEKAQEADIKKREEELQHQRELTEIKEKRLSRLEEESEKKIRDLDESLEAVASMTKKEAEDKMRSALEEEIKKDIAVQAAEMEEEMRAKAEERAKLSIAKAMTRYAAEVTSERSMETIPITGSVTKGKIIGREGRNIRALEAACGVDIIIGESQESINISCFDPVRRAVAKKTLQKLMEEGRMHPALIEETIRKTRKEILLKIKEDGEKTCFDAGIHDIHPNIVNVLGSLRYRFIEGRNLLKHSVEAAEIAALIAAELSLDEKPAKRAGLLHAAGLAVPHTAGGSYAEAGAEFCRRHGESRAICQAIRCHDGKVKAQSVLDHILQCTDSLSRSRGGAKKSVLEGHIQRMKDLESIANSFDGVTRSFAVRAGKEIRVLLDSAKVTNSRQMTMMSRDIADKIKRELTVSGEIKIGLIREYRIIEHAR